MCDAQTVMGFQYAGGINSAIGAFTGAEGQKTALGAQANIASVNAKISEDSAQSALLQGQREEQKVLLQSGELKSAQKTSMAANGIDLSAGGTPQNVLTSTDLMGKTDANTVNANAVRAAWGYRTQETGFENEALMDKTAASGINPFMSAGSSLLTSASSISMTRYRLQASGQLPPSNWMADGAALGGADPLGYMMSNGGGEW